MMNESEKNLGHGHWMEGALRGEFEGKTIKEVDEYPGWDDEAEANVFRFLFTDGTVGDLLVFYRGDLRGDSAQSR